MASSKGGYAEWADGGEVRTTWADVHKAVLDVFAQHQVELDALREQLEETRLQRDALASALADLGPEAVALGAIKMRAVGL